MEAPADWQALVDDALSGFDIGEAVEAWESNFRAKMNRAHPLTPSDAVKSAILDAHLATRGLQAITKSLFARVADLEARAAHTPKYRGVWKGDEYPEGSFVTHRGAVWHANRLTSARPGDGSPDWTLAVKAGKDGKDASA